MSLVLLNLQSKQQIELDSENPFVIGRENVIGCFDKRVSRSHGRITCTDDGRLRLLALHCNPCFFTRNGVPPVQRLNKNEEETLNEGDSLGLLPNAYWFKITSNRVREIKKEIDCSVDENNVTSSQPEERLTFENIQGNNVSSPVPSSNAEPTSSSSFHKIGTPEFERTRRLPLHMYEIDEANDSNKSPCKRSQQRDQESGVKRPKLSSEPEVIIKTEEKEVELPSTSKTEIKIESDDESSNPMAESQEVSNETTIENHESNVGNVSVTPAAKRPICQYEANCYRKNPQHKIEFSHPNDPDYIPYEQRPLCQYGGRCYRQNAQHRADFRHPPPGSNHTNLPSSSCSRGSIASSPLPDKRRRKQIQKQYSDNENDDEYDLDDPFINDASSDEYVPSEDSEEEEVLDSSQENN